MRNYTYIILFITLFSNAELYAQSQRFMVELAPFSSGTYDEFSPVFYKGGIVYCSNQSNNSLVSYKDEQNRLFTIVYLPKKDSTKWRYPKIFSKEITSDFNDGPVAFNEYGNIIYYSRNNSVENSLRNINDTSNKLGIYSAELIDGIWTNIRPFTYNNPFYSLSTPALAPDGSRIYFSSDMPGGYGGMDLYYCNSLNDGWDRPVNLGPVINTSKNESFPFSYKYGKLFFSSDGHKGFGGKDLFYTQEINGIWISPVLMDSTINSPADDFGIIIDSTFEKGYFSTNRLNTDDIFSFRSAPVEFANCDTVKENNYCFTFYDEWHQRIDTVPVTYIWNFGDGKIRIGKEVNHCFPGPGKYTVKLSIFDDLTGDTIAGNVNYQLELEDIEQVSINSYNVGIVDTPVSFDGTKAYLKDFHITDYLWNFGDGFKPGGPLMSQSFKKEGEYKVQLGLLSEKDSLGLVPKKCFMKKIKIFDSYQELELKAKRRDDTFNEKTDTVEITDKKLQGMIYFMDDLSGQQKTKIKTMIISPEELTVNLNKNGILPDSYQLLDNIIEVLKENPDIRLEMVTRAIENELPVGKKEISEIWAQELTLYFRNKEVSSDAYSCKGLGLSRSVFKPVVPENKTTDGVIEFIFMKN